MNGTHKGDRVDDSEEGPDLVHLGEEVQSLENLIVCALTLDRPDKAGEDDTEDDRSASETGHRVSLSFRRPNIAGPTRMKERNRQ
jgi:hypothetical protein